MSEWREFDKFGYLEWDDEKKEHVAKFEGKVSIRKDMVGAFEQSIAPECTRVFLKFGDSDCVIKCPYPEFYDWVTK